MTPLDLAVIAAYFIATVGLGLWLSRDQRGSGDYFLGARDLPAWAVMLSIVATETSAVTVISTPALGARGDLTFLQLPIGYLIGRLGVSLWLLPGYFRGDQETAYTRLETRFGPATRRALSLVFLITRFLGDGVRIFAGAIPLALLTDWSIPSAIVVMSVVTIGYTWFGGIKAVIWADVIQLVVYLAGGIAALWIASSLAGGFGETLTLAGEAGKLRVFNPSFSFTAPYTLLGGLLGGALLSAASHGTDHLIVQRLLATRSLRDARVALIGSGVVVIAQFLLFLLVGTALWAAQLAPETTPSNEIFGRFVLSHLPSGLRGLVIAGILAAAMSTISSSINALASSLTHDWYASLTGERDPAKLLRVGRAVSLLWGTLLTFGALGFHAFTTGNDTPAVVLALSIASVTYGALLGAYILAGISRRVTGPDVILAAVVTVVIMLVTVFSARLATAGVTILTPLGTLAWPWYVPIGTTIMVGVALVASRLRGGTASA
ncbi:MAG TPA: sodium:solute symporter [Gemmatimonadales bacterium]|nr:sodium:solute symporter [Gemmatimonadales bacterium]